MIEDADFLNKTDAFNTYMEQINKRLQDKGVPIHARQIQAFSEIALDGKPMIIGGIIKDKRAESVHDWFREHYGERLLIDFKFGHVVLDIDGDAYLYRVPYILGNWRGNIDMDKLIIGMTNQRWKMMGSTQREAIIKDLEKFFTICRQIRELPKNILSHLDIAADELVKTHPNYGVSKWESQLFTETLLKHYIAESGGKYPTGKDGHNLSKLIKIAKSHDLPEIEKKLVDANKCTSDERYQIDKKGNEVSVSQNSAIAAHHASLEIAYIVSLFLKIPPGLRKIDKAGLERVVVSLYVACSSNFPIFIVKVVFSDNNMETIHLTLKSAIWLKDKLAEAFPTRKISFSEDNLSEIDVIANKRFLEEQPSLTQMDWNNENGGKTVVSANIHETISEFGMIIKLNGFNEEMIFRLPNMVCYHFYRYLQDGCKSLTA